MDYIRLYVYAVSYNNVRGIQCARKYKYLYFLNQYHQELDS